MSTDYFSDRHLLIPASMIAISLFLLTPNTSSAEVCPANHRYVMEVTADDSPECLSVSATTSFDTASLEIENACETSVQLDHSNCESSCRDSLTVSAGSTDSVTLAKNSTSLDEPLTVAYDWELDGERQGNVEVEISNNPDYVDCDEWGSNDTGTSEAGNDATASGDAGGYSDTGAAGGGNEGGGCSTTADSTPSGPWSGLLVLLALGCWRTRRRSSDR